MISEIKSDIEEIEAETSIYELANFNARTDAIDFIDFHIIDRIEGLIQQVGHNDELIKLIERLKAILASEDMQKDIIREELREIRQRFGDARKTEITFDDNFSNNANC